MEFKCPESVQELFQSTDFGEYLPLENSMMEHELMS